MLCEMCDDVGSEVLRDGGSLGAGLGCYDTHTNSSVLRGEEGVGHMPSKLHTK